MSQGSEHRGVEDVTSVLTELLRMAARQRDRCKCYQDTEKSTLMVERYESPLEKYLTLVFKECTD